MSAKELAKANFLFKCRFYKDAVRVYEALSAQGDAQATYRLARIYRDGVKGGFWSRLTGWGKAQPEKARHYLDRALRLGSPSAQFEMAQQCRVGGPDGARRPEEAYKWACLAADNVHVDADCFRAMALLAELYASGDGCTQQLTHATLLRTIAEKYREMLGESIDLPPLDFRMPEGMRQAASSFSYSYYDVLKNTGRRLAIAKPDSYVLKSFEQFATTFQG